MTPGNPMILHDAGARRWYVYLNHVYDSMQVLADGIPMERSPERGWFFALHEPKVVTTLAPPRKRLSGGKLIDPELASARFPLEVDADWFELLDEDDPHSTALAALYERQYETVEPEPVTVPGPFVRLDGAPKPDDGLAWLAHLPYALRERLEYLHLFPGRLVGFREAMTKALAEIPGVSAHWVRGQAYVDVTVSIPLDVPSGLLYTYEHKPVGSRKKVTEAIRHYSWRERMNVPDEIRGLDRAEATREWNAQIAAAVERFTEATNAKLVYTPEATR